ncbi:unnamed protein product [Rotaria sp. Silwood2]|nr:unnamed protein product [Rotaria sp. Silwood2]CAF2642710.1 unnamed protein product [Rotaria sp. Silwood2]CAF3076680.1 unnamed protein product [Rotaria sp. Silwood2]CAF3859221.1 unnamed protein product [Rotaria sp. Silwood2]CAF4041560.1 unnamed protein product [Rotaria sp. Silwood2]
MHVTNDLNQQLTFDLSQCPQSFHDILTIIDVINVLSDKKRQAQFPEVMFSTTDDDSDEDMKFTRDDVEKSNSHFDTTADQQLISFMNKQLLVNKSFKDFIQSLSIEDMSDAAFYKTYSSLSNIPAAYIITRAKLFYRLSMLIEKVVPLLDFTLLPRQSILTDKIRAHKTYLLHPIKLHWFDQSLQKTIAKSSQDIPSVEFDTIKASDVDNKDEATMFHQAYAQLYQNAQVTFRREEEQLWQAQYIGMHSTDQGGPYRDSITRICSDICSTRLPLFILCPNGRTQTGLNRDRWIPNVFPPNISISSKVKNQYWFVGQLMGMAIRKKHYLDLKFPILLWKQLVQEQITMEDIEAIDMQSFTIINEMKKTLKRSQSIDTDSDINYLLSSIMSELRFDIVSSAGQTYELVPGGAKIPITSDNLKQYCSYYCAYRLNEFHRQIEFIRQGLYSIVPSSYLSLFTASNLEEAVCGKGQIDVELLKRNTNYKHISADAPHIQRFWTVLSELFDEDQRKLFLIFVWGRSILPSKDEEFTSKFTINPYHVNNDEVDKALPRK